MTMQAATRTVVDTGLRRHDGSGTVLAPIGAAIIGRRLTQTAVCPGVMRRPSSGRPDRPAATADPPANSSSREQPRVRTAIALPSRSARRSALARRPGRHRASSASQPTRRSPPPARPAPRRLAITSCCFTAARSAAACDRSAAAVSETTCSRAAARSALRTSIVAASPASSPARASRAPRSPSTLACCSAAACSAAACDRSAAAVSEATCACAAARSASRAAQRCRQPGEFRGASIQSAAQPGGHLPLRCRGLLCLRALLRRQGGQRGNPYLRGRQIGVARLQCCRQPGQFPCARASRALAQRGDRLLLAAARSLQRCSPPPPATSFRGRGRAWRAARFPVRASRCRASRPPPPRSASPSAIAPPRRSAWRAAPGPPPDRRRAPPAPLPPSLLRRPSVKRAAQISDDGLVFGLGLLCCRPPSLCRGGQRGDSAPGQPGDRHRAPPASSPARPAPPPERRARRASR